MLESYTGLLTENRIEWENGSPSESPVRVIVTVLEAAAPKASRGALMAAALQELADRGFGDAIPDPVAWQREQREDRPLPGRD